MKIIRLQVGYEKLFPQEYFDLNTYKKVIEFGLLDKMTNSSFEDESKLKEHLIRFMFLKKAIENNGLAEDVKKMNLEDIKVALVELG